MLLLQLYIEYCTQQLLLLRQHSKECVHFYVSLFVLCVLQDIDSLFELKPWSNSAFKAIMGDSKQHWLQSEALIVNFLAINVQSLEKTCSITGTSSSHSATAAATAVASSLSVSPLSSFHSLSHLLDGGVAANMLDHMQRAFVTTRYTAAEQKQAIAVSMVDNILPL